MGLPAPAVHLPSMYSRPSVSCSISSSSSNTSPGSDIRPGVAGERGVRGVPGSRMLATREANIARSELTLPGLSGQRVVERNLPNVPVPLKRVEKDVRLALLCVRLAALIKACTDTQRNVRKLLSSLEEADRRARHGAINCMSSRDASDRWETETRLVPWP
eukprot:2353248-Prymnesium_polylepis.5